MGHKKYTQAELVIGNRRIPETVRGLVVDYYDIYTKDPEELGFLTLQQALEMQLTESQRETLIYVVNDNLRRKISPQSGLRTRLNGRECHISTVSAALRKLQEYGLVRTMHIIDYASFFARYEKGGKPRIKFPNPLNYSLSVDHLAFFTRSKGSSKASLNKLFKYLGRMDRSCKLPRYSYARIIYNGEPLQGVFPKPDKFIPFHLYDTIVSN